MDITYRKDRNILYIALNGRIDASNAAAAEETIFGIIKANPGMHTVLDADQLAYISSAGLRVVLKVRRMDADLAIINVDPDVYSVLDMTGFTDMITVEKAYRRMSIEGCEFIAQGANGAVYRYDDETILKVFFAPDALPEIRQERENARRAFVLGINTAIPYGIVRVGDGYGTVTELLNAVSVTKLIRENPDDLTLPVKYYVDMLKSIHAIETEESSVPDMKKTACGWADFVADYLPEKQGEKLRALVAAVPDRRNLLHGDYHTNNIMVQNGEPVLIDMDTLSVGHPVFELASMFGAFIGYSEINRNTTMDFFGFSAETAEKFWNMTLQQYLGTEDAERLASVAEKAMVVGFTRMMRRAIRRPNEAESAARVEHCRKRLCALLDKVDTLDF